MAGLCLFRQLLAIQDAVDHRGSPPSSRTSDTMPPVGRWVDGAISRERSSGPGLTKPHVAPSRRRGGMPSPKNTRCAQEDGIDGQRATHCGCRAPCGRGREKRIPRMWRPNFKDPEKASLLSRLGYAWLAVDCPGWSAAKESNHQGSIESQTCHLVSPQRTFPVDAIKGVLPSVKTPSRLPPSVRKIPRSLLPRLKTARHIRAHVAGHTGAREDTHPAARDQRLVRRHPRKPFGLPRRDDSTVSNIDRLTRARKHGKGTIECPKGPMRSPATPREGLTHRRRIYRVRIHFGANCQSPS